jgi:hypothetical protein
MSRTRRALQTFRHAFYIDIRRESGWIDLVFFGSKNVIDLVLGEQRGVGREIARILRKVGLVVELFGIDEDRDDNDIGCPRASLTSARCPSCRAPMVGTKATVLFSRRNFREIDAIR